MNHKPILLVEDNPQDEMLILRAQGRVDLASFVRKPVDFTTFAETVGRMGVYWALANDGVKERPWARS